MLHLFTGRDTRELLAEGQAALQQISARLIPDDPEPAALDEILEDATNYFNPTGFTDLDALLDGGFRAGQLVVLAAQTSRGKSAFALNIATNFAKDRRRLPVAFFSLEMPRKQVRRRLYAAEANVSLRRWRFLSAEEHRSLLVADNRLRDLRLAIQYRPGLRPLDVRAETRQLRAEWGGLALVVVDYIGLMRSDGKEQNREREIASVTRDLKILAGEMNCSVLACAQLNREIDHRDRSQPRLSDLRDSGAVEQDADVVMFISQPDADNPERLITIAKNRDGALGEFTLAFRPEMTRFENPWAEEDQAA